MDGRGPLVIPILASEALYAYASPDRLPEDQREAFATWLAARWPDMRVVTDRGEWEGVLDGDRDTAPHRNMTAVLATEFRAETGAPEPPPDPPRHSFADVSPEDAARVRAEVLGFVASKGKVRGR